jgi:hypothetical protein
MDRARGKKGFPVKERGFTAGPTQQGRPLHVAHRAAARESCGQDTVEGLRDVCRMCSKNWPGADGAGIRWWRSSSLAKRPAIGFPQEIERREGGMEKSHSEGPSVSAGKLTLNKKPGNGERCDQPTRRCMPSLPPSVPRQARRHEHRPFEQSRSLLAVEHSTAPRGRHAAPGGLFKGISERNDKSPATA